MPPHGDLLRCRLGVEVDDDHPRPCAQGLDLFQHDGERIVERLHEDAAHDVDHADRFARPGLTEIAAAAGHPGGEVRRTQQLRLARDVIEDLLLVPDVIPRRHRVDAVAEDGVGDIPGDAEAGGGVLDVGDDEVQRLLFDERGHGAARDLAPRLAEDVADEKDTHLTPCYRNAAGPYRWMGMRISRPRRSVRRGRTTRSSPSTSLAVARPVSKAPSTPIARAKRPNDRPAR